MLSGHASESGPASHSAARPLKEGCVTTFDLTLQAEGSAREVLKAEQGG